MRILLIGATGQIGTALLHALACSPHAVRALVRDGSAIESSRGIETVVRAPFTQEVFEQALTGADHVIYGVGLPEQFLLDSSTFRRVNYGLLRSFLSALARSSCKRLTYVSTYEVFEAVEGKIREAHPVVEDTQGLTPYVAAMADAYWAVQEFSKTQDVRVTTIHPAAAYGGRNTGRGITDYIENLLEGRWWRVPFIIEGRFPVVHVPSLARAVIEALNHEGPFLVSDQMTSLREIALTLHRLADSFVPPVAPTWVAERGAALLEAVAHLTRKPPIMSTVQVRFLTQGLMPIPEKVATELGWEPTPLEKGLRQYVEDRPA